MTTVINSLQVTQNSGFKIGSGTTQSVFVNTASAPRTLTFPDITDTFSTRTITETLTNKTLTTPAIASILNGGTPFALPTSATADTLVARATTDTLTNKTLTAPVIATILNGSATLTLPATTDTLVGQATTDTLTNKTLTAPIISSIVNGSATLTLPTTSDTLVGRATTDTLTNKTIVGGVANGNSIVADQLINSTGTTSITGPAPTAGQILVAASGTTASWQTVVPAIPGITFLTGATSIVNSVTPAPLIVIPLPDTSTTYIDATVVAVNSTSPTIDQGAAFNISAAFLRNGSTITQISTTAETAFVGTGFTSSDASLIINTADVTINVVGQSLVTIGWTASVQVVSV